MDLCNDRGLPSSICAGSQSVTREQTVSRGLSSLPPIACLQWLKARVNQHNVDGQVAVNHP